MRWRLDHLVVLLGDQIPMDGAGRRAAEDRPAGRGVAGAIQADAPDVLQPRQQAEAQQFGEGEPDHRSALGTDLIRLDLLVGAVPRRAYARPSGDPVPGVRVELAKNPSIDEVLIRRLAEDRGHDVQRFLTHRPGLPLDVLEQLARSTMLGLPLLPRIAAATPAEVADLAAAADPTLRMLVALRRDLLDAIRDTLAHDCDAKVLRAIAPHPGLTEAQLLAMIDRHGPRVAAKAATNPDATAIVLERPDPSARFRAEGPPRDRPPPEHAAPGTPRLSGGSSGPTCCRSAFGVSFRRPRRPAGRRGRAGRGGGRHRPLPPR